jgi:hypothetical protein
VRRSAPPSLKAGTRKSSSVTEQQLQGFIDLIVRASFDADQIINYFAGTS